MLLQESLPNKTDIKFWIPCFTTLRSTFLNCLNPDVYGDLLWRKYVIELSLV